LKRLFVGGTSAAANFDTYMKHITILLLFCALSCIGCSSGTKVSGKITFEEDGSPVSKGVIVFDALQQNSYAAKINADGSYISANKKQNQGIPPGNYKIWLAQTEQIENTYGPAGETLVSKAIPQIAKEYCSVKTTPLELEVKSGGAMTFDIVIKKPAEKKKKK
jgi:hypothetical protein